MYIVAFNGPPRSGKDTLAGMVADRLCAITDAPVILESLSLPLRHIAHAMVGRKYQEAAYESFKEEYFERLDRTGRQLMIDVSESFLKPTYGIHIMADLLIQRTRKLPSNAIILVRDSGFQIEVDPLIREVGEKNLIVVQVHRPDTSFAGDSREWVYHPADQNVHIRNAGDLNNLEVEAGRVVFRARNQFGWKL